ncbi:hypothetical protein [Microbacterium resistens]
MSAPATRPVPLPPPAERTAARHEHGWISESRHPTSEGVIVYVRCTACGTRRVDLVPTPTLPPLAVTRGIGAPADTPPPRTPAAPGR